jgi:hypothetical protein
LIVVLPELLQHPHRVDSGQGHDRQKTAKTHRQCESGTPKKRPFPFRSQQIDLANGLSSRHLPHATRSGGKQDGATVIFAKKYQGVGIGEWSDPS